MTTPEYSNYDEDTVLGNIEVLLHTLDSEPQTIEERWENFVLHYPAASTQLRKYLHSIITDLHLEAYEPQLKDRLIRSWMSGIELQRALTQTGELENLLIGETDEPERPA